MLIVGAGGLGSPIALYLALAGVGTIGIVDFDVVDLSNLQRQILHQNDDIGKPKVRLGAGDAQRLQPGRRRWSRTRCRCTPRTRWRSSAQYDIIVNGADNFAARYLVNDACVFLKKPLVDGSILLFDGQATVYLPGKGCYRCLYPTPPPPGMVPSCAEAGVLGALCGTIGSIQATEVLKLILGIGEPLNGRLLLYDALSMELRQVRIRRDPNCVVCGDHPTITELIDYDAFCGTAPVGWTEEEAHGVSVEVRVTSVLQTRRRQPSRCRAKARRSARCWQSINAALPGLQRADHAWKTARCTAS